MAFGAKILVELLEDGIIGFLWKIFDLVFIELIKITVRMDISRAICRKFFGRKKFDIAGPC